MYKLFKEKKKYFHQKEKKKKAEIAGMIKPLQLKMEDEEKTVQPIQGIMPDSKEEYFVALGLNKLGLQYEFQKEVFGGNRTRGGQTVDFWVFTAPNPTPLFVHGTYWHRESKNYEDEIKQQRLKKAFKSLINEPMIIWANKIKNSMDAYVELRKMFFGE